MYGTFGPNLQYSQSQHKSPDTHYSLSHGTQYSVPSSKATQPQRAANEPPPWLHGCGSTIYRGRLIGFTARMLDDKDRLRGTRTVNLELLYTYAGGTRDSLESRMSEHGLNAPRKEVFPDASGSGLCRIFINVSTLKLNNSALFSSPSLPSTLQ